MVKSCKAYITEDGLTRIWDQPGEVIISKMKQCMQLYDQYQQAFQKAKKKIETSGERPFDFSEMYIFGKFEAFCKRMAKVGWFVSVVNLFQYLTVIILLFRAMTNSRSFGHKIWMFVLDMAHCYNVIHYTPNPTK